MKMKRLFALALAGVMAAGMLAGCGESDDGSTDTGVPGNNSAAFAKYMEAPGGVKYTAGTAELYSALASAAENVDAQDVESDGIAFDTDIAESMAKNLSGYEAGSAGESWTPKEGKYLWVIVADAAQGMQLRTVYNAAKRAAGMINERMKEAGEDIADFTESRSVAAHKTDDGKVWVIAVAVELTEKPAA